MNSAGRQHFLNDLRAAVMAGVPIDDGPTFVPATENLLTVSALDDIEARIPAGTELPDRLGVAEEVFVATNDMPLVLRGLSAANVASRKAIRSLRWTIAYLMIVLVVAWLGMMFFAIVVMPELQAMRTDMQFSRHPELATSPSYVPWMGYLAYILGILALIALIALCAGGIRKIVMLVGGRYFVRSRIEAIASEVSARLVGSGVDSDRANELAYRLAGRELRLSERSGADFKSHSKAIGSQRANLFHLRDGDRHLERIRASIPTLLIFLIGGGIALVYGTAVFAPIFELIRDLATSGV